MPHQHTADLLWQRDGQDFLDQRYSRRLVARFDGGAQVAMSSAPSSVPVPMSDAAAVDPEEMLVAALSSCHMLWFLSLAAQRGFRVDSYRDQAVGTMGRNAARQMVMTDVLLRPQVRFSGGAEPTRADLDDLHHAAHATCYIAHSVKCDVRCEPVHADG